MDKFKDDKDDKYYSEYEYTPPTRDALIRSMHSDGLYVGICKFCKQKVRGTSLGELRKHKCDEQT